MRSQHPFLFRCFWNYADLALKFPPSVAFAFLCFWPSPDCVARPAGPHAERVAGLLRAGPGVPQALASSRPGVHQRPGALAHHRQPTQLGPGIMVGPTMGGHTRGLGEGGGREGGGGGMGVGQDREGGGEYASAASRWMTTVLKATNFNPNKQQAPSSTAPGARHGGNASSAVASREVVPALAQCCTVLGVHSVF